MYHIKPDKRCQKSAQAIDEAMFELLKEKRFTDITVTDLQNRSHVGRSTFYRLFDTTDDVVIYHVNRNFELAENNFATLEKHDFLISFLKSFIQKGLELTNIITCGRIDLLIQAVKKNLIQRFPGSTIQTRAEVEYELAAFAGITMSVLLVWNERGQKESIEELADWISSQLVFLSSMNLKTAD